MKDKYNKYGKYNTKHVRVNNHITHPTLTNEHKNIDKGSPSKQN